MPKQIIQFARQGKRISASSEETIHLSNPSIFISVPEEEPVHEININTPSAAAGLPNHLPRSPPLPSTHLSTAAANTERVFAYGGPNNQPETWHKEHPSRFGFPITFATKHWESLKIDADREAFAKRDEPGTIVNTNISFDDPRLARYKKLARFESGSKFTLPAVDPETQKIICGLGSVERLKGIVGKFNKGGGEGEHVPRIALARVEVREEENPTPTPTTIRRSINITPTKQHKPTSPPKLSTSITSVAEQAPKHPSQGGLSVSQPAASKPSPRTKQTARKITAPKGPPQFFYMDRAHEGSTDVSSADDESIESPPAEKSTRKRKNSDETSLVVSDSKRKKGSSSSENSERRQSLRSAKKKGGKNDQGQ